MRQTEILTGRDRYGIRVRQKGYLVAGIESETDGDINRQR